jgi:hypothetical protein
MRLAQAQLCAALHKDEKSIERDLAVHNCVQPGPLWWAFDFKSAQRASNGRPPPGPQHNKTRQKNCQTFIGHLNAQLPGLELRLPTEAQWEYACRAGTQTVCYQEELEAIAWFRDNSDGATHEVGEKQPNAWGLYDMLGNVWEWCHDGHRDYTQEAVVDPTGSIDAGADRILRGGSWLHPTWYVRAAYRSWEPPGHRNDYLGFRCSILDTMKVVGDVSVLKQ